VFLALTTLLWREDNLTLTVQKWQYCWCVQSTKTEQIQAVVIFIYKITILGDKGRVFFFLRIADWPYKKRRGGYTEYTKEGGGQDRGEGLWLSFRTPANNHPGNLCFPSQQTLLTQPTRHSKKLPSLDSPIPGHGHKLLSPDKRTSRDQSKTWLCFGCSASGFQLD